MSCHFSYRFSSLMPGFSIKHHLEQSMDGSWKTYVIFHPEIPKKDAEEIGHLPLWIQAYLCDLETKQNKTKKTP